MQYRYIGNVLCGTSARDSSLPTITFPTVSGVTWYSSTVTWWNSFRRPSFRSCCPRLYEKFKPLMAKPDFPGDRDRVKAFCEDKDFPEK